MFSLLNFKRKLKSAPVVLENAHNIPYSEGLLDNLVKKDFQSVLRPLNLMLGIFLCSKYSIRHNFITPNNIYYNISGLVCALMYCSYSVYGAFSTFVEWSVSLHSPLHWSSILEVLVSSFGFILHYINNMKHRCINITLVLKIQFAIKVLEFSSNELKSLKIYNWLSIIIMNVIWFVSIVFFFFYFYEHLNVIGIISLYSAIIFDVSLLYAAFVMKLLRKLLAAWTDDVVRSKNIGDSQRESYWNAKYNVYRSILEAYKIVEKTFGELIAFSIVNTACHGLLNIVALIQIKDFIMKGTLAFTLLTIISKAWLCKSIILEIFLSMECEKFYSAMKKVQITVTPLIQSTRYLEKQLPCCKNIHRVHRADYEKMSACGLFVVDAMMSLRLFDFITTYTIVIMQFSFL